MTLATVNTYTKTPIYKATATFVVAPNAAVGDTGAIATQLNILSNREQILVTYAEVATSRTVKQSAAEAIGLTSPGRYSVDSDLIRGSNVLLITVEGPDPATVQRLTNAIGDETLKRAELLYEIYRLNKLDEAPLPNNPISPNKAQDLILAGTLGLALAVSMAFLMSYLEAPSDSVISVNIFHNETGAYNKDFFLQRLGEEMVRAKRNRYPLSIALMRIENLNMIGGFSASRVRSEALRHMATLTRRHLREEDLVSYFGNDIFAFMLLDTSGEQAQGLMEYLQNRVAWAPFKSEINNIVTINLSSTVGVATYDYDGAGRNQLIDMAFQALQLAEVNENGKVVLSSEIISKPEAVS